MASWTPVPTSSSTDRANRANPYSIMALNYCKHSFCFKAVIHSYIFTFLQTQFLPSAFLANKCFTFCCKQAQTKHCIYSHNTFSGFLHPSLKSIPVTETCRTIKHTNVIIVWIWALLAELAERCYTASTSSVLMCIRWAVSGIGNTASEDL